MAKHTIKIPELGNAELTLTVDVERIPITDLTDAEIPSFAQLRPVKVVIQLGGDEVYRWDRPQAEHIEAGTPIDASAIASGGARAHRLR